MTDEIFDKYLQEDMLRNRQHILNSTFEWTSEKIEHIKKLGEAITKQENLLAKKVKQMAKDYNSLFEHSHTDFKDFYIEGNLRLKQNIKLPFVSIETRPILWHETQWQCEVTAYTEKLSPDSDDDIFLRDFNWNIEIFDKRYVGDAPIPYFLHRIFADNSTYSLEDLMRITPDDFVMDIKIYFDKWSKVK